jgi:hypothetical protein
MTISSQGLRIATTFLLTLYIYIIITQTRLMSSSLFLPTIHVSLYDAPFLSKSNTSSSSTSSSAWHQQPTRSALPQWIRNYFDWHVAMRTKYPGESLLTDPNAPGVLVKTCAYKCGGLHDRLGGLGWDLYFANQTNRVLLMHWCIPAPIEHYLVPNVVDWMLPYNESSGLLDARLFSNTTETHIHCDRAVEAWHGLFDGWREYMQGDDFFLEHIDLALDRANNGEYKQHRILRMNVLGFDDRLKERLRVRHNETDPVVWSNAFPALFWTLFQPSEGLQSELDLTFKQLGISSFQNSHYYALHARIRHPRGHNGQKLIGKGGGGPDKGGMVWEGSQREFAISVAQHSLYCAQKEHLNRHTMFPEKYIFYADSEELVTHMGMEYAADGVRVRNMTGVEVLHIDRQQGYPPRSYYSSFVDLFVAAQAS